MSDIPTSPIRERVNARRSAPQQGGTQRRGTTTRWPWNDYQGRLSTLKTVMLMAAAAPLCWLIYAWPMHLLGSRPATEAIHVTGLWAIRFLLLSLLVSPARAIFHWQRIMLVRRQLGLTALAYAVIHVVLYARDQDWVLTHVASEILQRFYLTIGLVALVGQAVLGVTSTDQAQRALGRAWKRLHQAVYALTLLAVFHFFLQSKADVSEATLMAGIFLWLRGWRLLPSGADRAPLPILALAVAAATATLGVEYLWFALGTKVDPLRVLLAELDVSYGLHPVGQVLVIGCCLALATTLLWAQHRERLRKTLPFAMALYGGGALIVAAVLFCFSLTDDWLPDDWNFWTTAAAFVAVAAMLGVGRWWLPAGRRVLDGAIAAGLLLPILIGLAV